MVRLFIEFDSFGNKLTALLLDVTDKGVPRVPANFPTCPNKKADRIESLELVDLRSIGTVEESSSKSSKVFLIGLIAVLLA